MPLIVKITSETREKGVFYAKGVVTKADGTEKGKASVLVRQSETKGPELVVLPEVAKNTILGNEVSEYKSYSFDGLQAQVELAKDVELTFSKLSYAI